MTAHDMGWTSWELPETVFQRDRYSNRLAHSTLSSPNPHTHILFPSPEGACFKKCNRVPNATAGPQRAPREVGWRQSGLPSLTFFLLANKEVLFVPSPPSPLKKISLCIYLCVCVFKCVCSVPCVCSVLGSMKRTLGPLDLELEMVEPPCVCWESNRHSL